MGTREPSHAGSWYSDDEKELTAELEHYLSQVPDELPGLGKLPIQSARIVMSPHAGYTYSGPCAAWAYKSLDLSNAKRIFILHPSHHAPLSTCALPSLTSYSTPLSDDPLPLDTSTIQHLSTLTTSGPRPQSFTTMSPATDTAEHSMEMQLPYLHLLLKRLFPSKPPSSYPPLVPIMVGSTSSTTEKAFGALLAPYLADPTNAFIISTDFCHWGSRFSYTYYMSSAPSPPISPSGSTNLPTPTSTDPSNPDLSTGQSLTTKTRLPSSPKIWESIAHADRACMCAIATGSHANFLSVLKDTGNTVCGRHPIGVVMAGLEEARRAEGKGEEWGRWSFVRYERSGDVGSVRESSVSYVSGVCLCD
ncbi:MAG: hypothetical protein Q9160_007851 [Pyrenula sp. 1 TL-2023]